MDREQLAARSDALADGAWRQGPAVSVTAVKPKLIEPEPGAGAHPSWIKPLSTYDRRHSGEIHGGRYG